MSMHGAGSPEVHGDTTRPLVALVDDDESVRESLPDLFDEIGYSVSVHASAQAFLASDALTAARCLVLDIAMPDMSGPELQQELRNRGVALPIVFITAWADASLRDRLITGGAVDCLFKPFSRRQMRAALAAALRSR